MLQLGEPLKKPTTMIAKPRTAPVDACPMCNKKESVTLFSAPDRLHGTPGTFSYKRCQKCQTVFQDPRVIPDDLAMCYPGDYYTHYNPSKDGQAVAEWPTPSRWLTGARDLIRQAVVSSVKGSPEDGFVGLIGRLLATNGRIRERAFFNHVDDELLPRAPGVLRALDIGCGSGGLMKRLRWVGWEVEGVEWDIQAAASARRNSGCLVREGDFRKIKLPIESYQLVVMSHVLEHLDDPVDGLKRVKELLVCGGRLVLYYPNPDALGATVFKDAWFPWEPPRHLVFPPARAITKIAENVGLTQICVKTRARWASAFFSYSRAYRAGLGFNGGDHKISRQDEFQSLCL